MSVNWDICFLSLLTCTERKRLSIKLFHFSSTPCYSSCFYWTGFLTGPPLWSSGLYFLLLSVHQDFVSSSRPCLCRYLRLWQIDIRWLWKGCVSICVLYYMFACLTCFFDPGDRRRPSGTSCSIWWLQRTVHPTGSLMAVTTHELIAVKWSHKGTKCETRVDIDMMFPKPKVASVSLYNVFRINTISHYIITVSHVAVSVCYGFPLTRTNYENALWCVQIGVACDSHIIQRLASSSKQPAVAVSPFPVWPLWLRGSTHMNLYKAGNQVITVWTGARV